VAEESSATTSLIPIRPPGRSTRNTWSADPFSTAEGVRMRGFRMKTQF
jgi:hypothetical protein